MPNGWGPQYVSVIFPIARKVRIDGKEAGMTNDTLMVDGGRHVFDLGEPRDYEPASVEKDVHNTTPIAPLIINDFHPRQS
jgi:hypothetical protein